MDVGAVEARVMKALAGAEFPAALPRHGEVLADPHLLAHDMIVEVEHPVRGRYVTSEPIKLSASPTSITAAPLLVSTVMKS